jgi:hypothetical protein
MNKNLNFLIIFDYNLQLEDEILNSTDQWLLI